MRTSLTIRSGEFVGKTFLLKDGDNMLGRFDPEKKVAPQIDLELYDKDAKVSRAHAAIEVSLEGVEIRDLGSRNGTFVNRQIVPLGQRVELFDGDEVIIGKLVLAVAIG